MKNRISDQTASTVTILSSIKSLSVNFILFKHDELNRYISSVIQHIKNYKLEMEDKHPTYANGKICYIEIPSDDVQISSAFYETVFDWKIRCRDDGSVSFDDGAGEVSGTWVTDRTASTQIGLMISIMVDDINVTIELVSKNGGKITEPVGRHLPEITAQFSDPFGNLWGLYQHRRD